MQKSLSVLLYVLWDNCRNALILRGHLIQGGFYVVTNKQCLQLLEEKTKNLQSLLILFVGLGGKPQFALGSDWGISVNDSCIRYLGEVSNLIQKNGVNIFESSDKWFIQSSIPVKKDEELPPDPTVEPITGNDFTTIIRQEPIPFVPYPNLDPKTGQPVAPDALIEVEGLGKVQAEKYYQTLNSIEASLTR